MDVIARSMNFSNDSLQLLQISNISSLFAWKYNLHVSTFFLSITPDRDLKEIINIWHAKVEYGLEMWLYFCDIVIIQTLTFYSILLTQHCFAINNQQWIDNYALYWAVFIFVWWYSQAPGNSLIEKYFLMFVFYVYCWRCVITNFQIWGTCLCCHAKKDMMRRVRGE